MKIFAYLVDLRGLEAFRETLGHVEFRGLPDSAVWMGLRDQPETKGFLVPRVLLAQQAPTDHKGFREIQAFPERRAPRALKELVVLKAQMVPMGLMDQLVTKARKAYKALPAPKARKAQVPKVLLEQMVPKVQMALKARRGFRVIKDLPAPKVNKAPRGRRAPKDSLVL